MDFNADKLMSQIVGNEDSTPMIKAICDYNDLPLEKQEAINKARIEMISQEVFGKEGQVENFVIKQPIFYDKAGLWWLWNKDSCCWERVDEVDILNFIRDRDGCDIISSKARNELLNGLKQAGRKNI